MHALEEHKQLCKSESGYGSETNLRRHPSLGSLASAASASVASTGSFRVIIRNFDVEFIVNELLFVCFVREIGI